MDHPARRMPRLVCRAVAATLAAGLALALMAALLGGTATGARASAALRLNGFDLAGALVPPAAIQRGGPPRDGIPAIDQPRFVAAARASQLQPADRVLGLVIAGDARAYPIAILNWHEIVNDRVGGKPVVVTFCPLCGTGMAFDARLGIKPSTFGVSGLLYNSDVLLYDRETESLWSQIMMTAVTGPMKGRELTPLPLAHTSWADWRARHPGTRVLSTDTGHRRDYGRDPYRGYEQVPTPMFEVAHQDDRVPAKAWVLGVRVGRLAKAYPLDALAQGVGADGRLPDELGGQPLLIHYDAEHRSARVTTPDGHERPSLMAYWFAWAAFHPDTALWTPPR